MEPEYGVAERLASEARRVKTWVEVEKARLTGSGLQEPPDSEADASPDGADKFS